MTLTPNNIRAFRKVLRTWGRKQLRQFPWRGEQNRYRILLAELMLRRTRAEQVVPVYERVIRRYTTVEEMAAAPAAEVRGLLKPLGLAWRANNVIAAVREIASDYGGRVPNSVNDLKNLTGVGDYVANAVVCFAEKKPVSIIDTNVVRVIGRVFGLRLDGEARRRRQVREAVAMCLDRRQPRLYNYALLDFAARVCLPTKPLCRDCPFGRPGRLHRCEYDMRHSAA